MKSFKEFWNDIHDQNLPAVDESFLLNHNTQIMNDKFYEDSRNEFKSNITNTQHHENIVDHDDEASKSSIFRYTIESKEINHGLISGKVPKHFREHVSDLDAVTNHPHNKLPETVYAYSGLGKHSAKKLSNAKLGASVRFPAFTSTSLSHTTAKAFSKPTSLSGGDRHMAVFHLPKDYSKGRYIDHISYHSGEREVLLARNQKFRLGSRSNVDDTTYHHLHPIEDE